MYMDQETQMRFHVRCCPRLSTSLSYKERSTALSSASAPISRERKEGEGSGSVQTWSYTGAMRLKRACRSSAADEQRTATEPRRCRRPPPWLDAAVAEIAVAMVLIGVRWRAPAT
jgi:hypothetical protein